MSSFVDSRYSQLWILSLTFIFGIQGYFEGYITRVFFIRDVTEKDMYLFEKKGIIFDVVFNTLQIIKYFLHP